MKEIILDSAMNLTTTEWETINQTIDIISDTDVVDWETCTGCYDDENIEIIEQTDNRCVTTDGEYECHYYTCDIRK